MSSSTDQQRSSSLARGVVATAAYTSRPPSPPYIYIPSLNTEGKDSLSIVPSFSNMDSMLLTKEDLEIITGGKTHIAVDNSNEWRYEGRRTAHPLLDFLSLGPISMIRDESFIKTEGITMVLCILDWRMSATFKAHQSRAEALGIAADKVFIDSKMDLYRNFEPTVKIINDHLLSVYRGQAVQVGEGANQGQMAIDKTAEFKRGKVLVCCETGNDRSACVCAAYLMAIFGLSHVQAIQFVSLKRFSANFDDDSKMALRSYADILKARRDVMGVELQASSGHVSHGKRQIEDTMDISDDEASGEMDRERYVGRAGFVPFVDGTP
ncbi:putative dual specificity phosphatase [Rhypophila sp. PSN 637]